MKKNSILARHLQGQWIGEKLCQIEVARRLTFCIRKRKTKTNPDHDHEENDDFQWNETSDIVKQIHGAFLDPKIHWKEKMNSQDERMESQERVWTTKQLHQFKSSDSRETTHHGAKSLQIFMEQKENVRQMCQRPFVLPKVRRHEPEENSKENSRHNQIRKQPRFREPKSNRNHKMNLELLSHFFRAKPHRNWRQQTNWFLCSLRTFESVATRRDVILRRACENPKASLSKQAGFSMLSLWKLTGKSQSACAVRERWKWPETSKTAGTADARALSLVMKFRVWSTFRNFSEVFAAKLVETWLFFCFHLMLSMNTNQSFCLSNC